MDILVSNILEHEHVENAVMYSYRTRGWPYFLTIGQIQVHSEMKIIDLG